MKPLTKRATCPLLSMATMSPVCLFVSSIFVAFKCSSLVNETAACTLLTTWRILFLRYWGVYSAQYFLFLVVPNVAEALSSCTIDFDNSLQDFSSVMQRSLTTSSFSSDFICLTCKIAFLGVLFYSNYLITFQFHMPCWLSPLVILFLAVPTSPWIAFPILHNFNVKSDRRRM